MTSTGPSCHVLIEVDGIACHSDKAHDGRMPKVRQTFKFGKWRSIYGSEGDCAGQIIVQFKKYSFKVYQAKFIQESLRPISILGGRKSNKKASTTDSEKSQLRAVLGGCNWVQKETRPDAAATTSLGMSRINCSTVQDLSEANV